MRHQPLRSIGSVTLSQSGQQSPSGMMAMNILVAIQMVMIRMTTKTPMKMAASVHVHEPAIVGATAPGLDAIIGRRLRSSRWLEARFDASP
jgi:hypothetical protein